MALPWLGLSTVSAQEATLKICQSTALTGPLGDLGTALQLGAKAAFDTINAKGGIHGRQIVLQTLDDGYEIPRAMANLNTFLADRDCFALFNCFGTPHGRSHAAQGAGNRHARFSHRTPVVRSVAFLARATFSIFGPATPRRPKKPCSTWPHIGITQALPWFTRTMPLAKKC
ncbi:MAG: ABC transporter substrate-binding protein [Giesbergeria sp.]